MRIRLTSILRRSNQEESVCGEISDSVWKLKFLLEILQWRTKTKSRKFFGSTKTNYHRRISTWDFRVRNARARLEEMSCMKLIKKQNSKQFFGEIALCVNKFRVKYGDRDWLPFELWMNCWLGAFLPQVSNLLWAMNSHHWVSLLNIECSAEEFPQASYGCSKPHRVNISNRLKLIELENRLARCRSTLKSSIGFRTFDRTAESRCV